MADQMGTGVKFESAQAERNIDSFVRKVGKLASTAREAKVNAEQLGRNWERANTSVAAAGVNADKAAKGVLSFSRAAGSASQSARGLMSSLSEAKIGTAARALGTLATRAGAASGRMLDASKSAGSLATQANRAAAASVKLRSGLASVATAANAAHSALLKVGNTLDIGKINSSTRAFGSLVGSFRAGSQRLTTYSGDAQKLVAALTRVGSSGTVAAAGINRVSNSLGVANPKMDAAITKARALGVALHNLGGTTSVKVNATTTGNAARGFNPSRGGNSGVTLPALSPNAGSAMRAYAANISAARGQLGGMADQLVSLRNLAKYYIAGLGITTLAQYADTVNLVRSRISLLTSDFRVQAVMEEKLQSVSLRTRTNYDDNAKLFVKLGQAGKAYGVNLTTAMTVTENVAKALKISGASAQETASTITQLSQAFASGKLQGDELRSVLENSPRLAQAFSEKLKDMGVNLGNIRQFAKEGKIGINEMVKVLGDASLTKELSDEFKKIPLTMADALTQAKTNLMFFVGDLDKSFGISTKVVSVIQLLSSHFTELGIVVGIAATAIVLSYVPAMKEAIVQTARFLALNVASYGSKVAGAAGAAANAYRLLGKEIKFAAAANSAQGASQLAAIPGVMTRIGTAARATAGLVFGSFASMTVGVVAGVVALGLYRSKFKPIADEAGTTSDYLVTAFGFATDKISSVFSTMWDNISSNFDDQISALVGKLDTIYKWAKSIAGDIADTPGQIGRGVSTLANKVTFGMVGTNYSGNIMQASNAGRAAQWSKSGLGQDFGGAVQGSKWADAANLRAQNRNMDAFMKNNPWLIMNSGLKNDTSGLIPPPKPKGDGGKKSQGKKDTSVADAKREAEAFAKELDSLKSSIDPVERARQTFNGGVDTLTKAMARGKVTAAEYKMMLGQLGTDTFPGLTEDIKTLTRENSNLQSQLNGNRKVDDKVIKARDTATDQLDLLDKVIAKQGDSTGELARQKTIIKDQLTLYTGLVAKNDELTQAAEARAQKEKEIADLIENAMNRTQEAFVSAVDNLLKGSKSLFSSLLTLGRQTISQYLGNALFSSIQEDLKGGLKKVFGVKDKKFVGIGSGGLSVTPAANDNGSTSSALPTISPDGSMKVTIAGVQTNIPETTTDKSVASDAGGEVVVNGKRPETFVQGVKSGYTGLVKGVGGTLVDSLKTVGKTFSKGLDKLGIKVGDGALGRGVGRAMAGAQVGSAAADVTKALGIKSSKMGGTLGGALGGAIGGPLGSVVGGVLGSIVGGLFKKTVQSSANIEVKNGVATAAKATGGSKETQAAAAQLSAGVASGLNDIASQVGGTLSGATGISVGYRPGHKEGAYRVDPTGQGRTTGVLAFDDEADAIEAALKLSVKNGIIKGLSETSDRVLKTFTDITRAVQVASTIENVKKTAASIRNPMASQMAEIKKEFDTVSEMFKEAGASVADYADLNLVYSQKFADAIKQSISGLYDFRDSLKTGDLSYASPTTKLAAADDKFSSFEKRIASGDFNFTQDEFTKAGTTAQGLAREVYGSTPEFAAFQQRLIDATDKVIANAEKSASEYAPVIEALNKQTDAIVSGNAALVAAIEANGGASNDDTPSGGGSRTVFNQANFL